MTHWATRLLHSLNLVVAGSMASTLAAIIGTAYDPAVLFLSQVSATHLKIGHL